MIKSFFSKTRHIPVIRTSAFFLALFLLLGAANLPVYALDNPVSESNSDFDLQTQAAESGAAAETETTGTAATEADSGTKAENSLDQMNITSNTALIFGTGRGMILYHNREDIASNYPAASKLMTAVIALEALTLDTQVTISSDAEKLDEASKNPLFLSKGEKCSVKYLVTAIIYMNSDAAAYSLAEYISSDIPSFVTRMNETAKALNMSSTLFANTSGEAALTTYPSSAAISDYRSSALQYTTISDLSLLFRYALNNQEFRDLFTKYKSLMFLADGTPQTLTNTISAAWGLNPQLKGAAKFESDNTGSASCVLALASVDDFEIAIILGGSQDDSIYQDLYKSINNTYSSYEVSDLVVAGDTYMQVSVKNIPEPLTAVFESTVRYIHPVGDDYLKSNATFIADDTVTLPVIIGQSLGQVRFELEDGTLIDTEVVSSEGMWTKSDFLSDTIALLKANSNLYAIIGIAFAFFIGSVIRSLILFFLHHFRSHRHP